MDYKTKITQIGRMAAEFFESGMIIVFNEKAPQELADISVLHTVAELRKDVRIHDTVIIGSNKYIVTAVGDSANQTLKNMGHCTFCFNGDNKTELPGQIELSGDSLPNLVVGGRLEILFRN